MKKKILFCISVLLAFLLVAQTVAAEEFDLDGFYSSCKEALSNIELTDENIDYVVKSIENSYGEFSQLETWPSEEERLETVLMMASSATYFDMYLDENTVGKEIASLLFDAINSLHAGDGEFHNKISVFKEKYEELMNTTLYLNKFSEGQYKIGQDIASGEYVIFSNDGRGYYAVSRDPNENDIISNDNFTYNSIVTVNDGEYLKLSRCFAVPLNEVSNIPIDTGNMFKVGLHIPAGEYKLISDSNRGYYCIYSDGYHSNIVANDNFEGQAYVSLSDGQYLLLSRCHIE